MQRKWWTLLVVCSGTFMLLLDVTAVTVAVPSIQRGLHSSYAQVQWMIDAYALMIASFLLSAGTLADRYGRKLVFIAGLVVFILSSVACGVAQSPLMLICARCTLGIGGAAMYATSLALIAQSFHGRERGTAFGVWGSITGVALALGPILGGLVTTGISWRGIFLINVPVGIAALVFGMRWIEESRTPASHRLDLAGFGLMTLFLISLVYGLIRAGEVSWGNGLVIACFVIAVVSIVLFVVRELSAEHPMLDLSLFRVPTVTGGNIASFSMHGSLFAVQLYLALYLQEDRGYSALATGLRMLLISGGMMVPRLVSGYLSSRVSVRWILGPGLMIVGGGLILMAGLDGMTRWTHLIPGLIVAGFGSGLVNPALATTAVGTVQPHQSGMASGVNSTFRQIGMATSIAAFGTIFGSSLRRHLSSALAHTPALATRSNEISNAVRKGGAQHLIATAPAQLRGQLAAAIHSSFASSMDTILLIAAGVAIFGALSVLVLVRAKDFAAYTRPAPEAAPSLSPSGAAS